MGKRLIACPVCLGYGWLPLKRPWPYSRGRYICPGCRGRRLFVR